MKKTKLEIINDNIQTAKEIGRFLITVTYLDKDNKLQHSWMTEKFPKDDILKSLDEIKRDVIKKEFPSDCPSCED